MVRVRLLAILILLATACKKDHEEPAPSGPQPLITSVVPLSGSKGTEVSVTGKNFLTDPALVSVYIGSRRIQPFLLSDTLLKIILPPRCGSGRMTVVSGDQQAGGPDFEYIYTVTVQDFSGTPGVAGMMNGSAQTALFNHPRGITIDSLGNLFVADELNHLIRRISPDGSVVTYAGDGVPGHADGVGTAARFNHPYDIDADLVYGSFYVADKMNHCIRRISANGSVTTPAGIAGSPGYVDAPGPGARFNFPTGVAVEGELVNVYVADGGNHCVRRLDFNGVVTTFAGSGVPGMGDGTGTGAIFTLPYDVAWDTAGFVYVTDTINNNIRKIRKSNRAVTTAAGSGFRGYQDGSGALAQFDSPLAVASRFQEAVVCDGSNNRIRFIASNGFVKTFAGDGVAGYQNGPGSTSRFSKPGGIVRDRIGDYFISDTYNHCIRKMVVD